MAGYAARDGSAETTLDPLTVSCLALQAGANRFALIAIDLIGVDEAMVTEVAQATGLPAASIAICASHTHSGPAGVLSRLHPADRDAVDPDLRALVIRTMAHVVDQALGALADATLTFAHAPAAGVSANRNTPDGPFDPTVSVLSARTPTGDPIATVVHFACHPTILPASSRVISADFPGAVRAQLPAADFGVVLYANGAAGDVSTRFTRRSQDVAEAQRVGAAVAAAVRSAGVGTVLSPYLEAKCRMGRIRLRDRAEIETELSAADRAASHVGQPLTDAERRIAETRAQGADLLRQMADRIGEIPDQIQVCAWTLGALTLIGFPGELFASLGLEIIRWNEPALLLGYTNGYHGYFPDRAAYAAGTYEALASPYASGASEELMEWLRDQL